MLEDESDDGHGHRHGGRQRGRSANDFLKSVPRAFHLPPTLAPVPQKARKNRSANKKVVIIEATEDDRQQVRSAAAAAAATVGGRRLSRLPSETATFR
jgi:hypothetical protein